MVKIRDIASGDNKEKRQKKLASYGLNCYLTEGESMKFLAALEKLATSVYYRYGIKDDLDFWLDESRDKVLDLLPKYDPSKGAFVPWVFSALRNKATNISRRGQKKQDDPNGEVMAGIEGKKYVVDDIAVYDFCRIGIVRGLEWDAEALLADVQEGIWSPMIQVAAWMQLKGEF